MYVATRVVRWLCTCPEPLSACVFNHGETSEALPKRSCSAQPPLGPGIQHNSDLHLQQLPFLSSFISFDFLHYIHCRRHLMSSDPRLSKRESSTTLRRDALPPPSGRKRAGSTASTASRASLMFMSPAKHFGLARKASTATLSVAPVSVSGDGVDHTLDAAASGSGKGSSATRGSRTDKLRPARQGTRAEDVLRSVQTRAPQASISRTCFGAYVYYKS
jgi:hypothetical protein